MSTRLSHKWFLLFQCILNVCTVFSFNCSFPCKCTNDEVVCHGTRTDANTIILTVSDILMTYSNNIEKTVVITVPQLPPIPDYLFNGSNIGVLKIINSKVMNLSEYALFGLKDSLSELDLSGNELMKVPKESLSYLEKLKKLYLSRNFIFKINAGDFEFNKKLNVLYLDRNQIKLIDDNSFADLIKLSILNISVNKLAVVSKNTFFNLESLTALSLSKNRLTELSEDVFEYTTDLQTLEVKKNPFNSFKSIQVKSKTLKTLWLDDCSIESPLEDGVLQTLPNIVTLELNYNPIKEIYAYAFSKFVKLEVLALNHCNLTKIQETAFKNLTNLKELYLNHNNLSEINCRHLLDMDKLQAIHLEHNNLKTISSETFVSNSDLQDILLEGNPLQCSCNLPHFDYDDDVLCFVEADKSSYTNVGNLDFDSMNCLPGVKTCEMSTTTTAKLEITTALPVPTFSINIINIDEKIENDVLYVNFTWNIDKTGYIEDKKYKCRASYFITNPGIVSIINENNCISSNNISDNFTMKLIDDEGYYNICVSVSNELTASIIEINCTATKYENLKPKLIFTSIIPSNETDSVNMSAVTTSELPSNVLTSTMTYDKPTVILISVQRNKHNETFHSIIISWTLSTEILQDICIMKVSILLNNKMFYEKRKPCRNASQKKDGLENNRKYQVCVTRYYNNIKKEQSCLYSSVMTSVTIPTYKSTATPSTTEIITTSSTTSTESSMASVTSITNITTIEDTPTLILLSVQRDLSIINAVLISWDLTAEIPDGICKLNISIQKKNDNIEDQYEWDQCVDGSLTIVDLEIGQAYKICITKYYNYIEKNQNCTDYFIPLNYSFAKNTQNSPGTKFSTVILVIILVLILVIVIALIIVLTRLLIIKSAKSNSYYVAKEEEENRANVKRKSNLYSVSSVESDSI